MPLSLQVSLSSPIAPSLRRAPSLRAKRSNLLFCFCVSLALSPNAHAAEKATLKQIDTIPISILFAAPLGRLILKDPRSDTLYLWEPKDQKATEIFHFESPANFNYRTSMPAPQFFARSPSGRYLILPKEMPYGRPLYSDIKILDLGSEKLESFAVSETRTAMHLPLFSKDDENYFLTTADAGKRTSWIFPIGEYLEDLKNGRAQPTGFYLHALPEQDSLGNVFSGSFSPDGTELILLTQPVKEIEVPASPLRKPRGASLRRVELASGKVKDYPLFLSAIRVDWIQENTVLILGEDSQGMHRFHLDTGESEVFIPDVISSFRVSSDSNWVWVSALQGARSDRTAYLIHYPTLRKIPFNNVSAAFFTPDNQTLVVQRVETKGGKPYLEIPLSSLLATNSVTVSEEKDLAKAFGAGIPVWEIPKDPELFSEKIVQQSFYKTKLNTEGWDLFVTFQNKSREHFGFDPKIENLGLDCELVSEKGEVMSTYTPDDDDSPVKRAIPKTMAPGQTVLLDCGPVTEKPLPPLFRGKIKYRIHGYEKAFEGEVEVP